MVAACSSSSSTSTGSPQRSATCLAFQDAYCDYFADRCGKSTRAACDDTTRALFCKSDPVVAACVEALPDATCAASPDACRDGADPARAVSLCNELGRRMCATLVRCGGQAQSECQAEIDEILTCSSAVGAAPEIDLCFRALDAATCPMTALPDPCRGVIKARTDDSALSRSDPWGVTVPL